MSDQRYIRLKRIFAMARNLSGDERTRLLYQECGRDPGLRLEIEDLLRSHDDDLPFLERPALGEAFSLGRRDYAPGDRVGAYTILEPIGEGGMGVVYLAEQQQPHRTVALKLIRPGLAGKELVRRFEREAEALGHLSHPGIAQIYEAGVSDGVPFIAMERVQGLTLLEHVRVTQPDLEARLQLFLGICEAVQHAHQHGVIHRDLKPGNLLVEQTMDGARARILDFGVARVTSTELCATTLQTHLGELIGTIQYMSPEQASGDSRQVDTRSDVYCLGVILFELLSGRLPYDLTGRVLQDATRVIREEEPTSLAALDPSLRGDLDTIVGKALEKDRERRYASAGELAADLRRHLNDEPIVARAPSAIYQLRKFARRNRALVIGVAVVLLTLAAGLLGTTWKWLEADQARAAEARQRIRSEQLLNDLRRLARTFIFDFHDRIQYLPGSLDARRLIVSAALAYLDRLAHEAPAEPALLFELALAYGRIGDIQGLPSMPNVGDTSGALKSYETAQALLDRVPADASSRERLWRERINTLLRLGDLHGTRGDSGRALEFYTRAQARAREQLEQDLSNARVEAAYSTTCQRLGDLLFSLGRTDAALEQLETAREIARRLGSGSDDPAALRAQAVAELKLSELHRANADPKNLTRPERCLHWKQARDLLEQSRSIFLEFRTRGVLPTADDSVPEELAREIEACEEAIASEE